MSEREINVNAAVTSWDGKKLEVKSKAKAKCGNVTVKEEVEKEKVENDGMIV